MIRLCPRCNGRLDIVPTEHIAVIACTSCGAKFAGAISGSSATLVLLENLSPESQLRLRRLEIGDSLEDDEFIELYMELTDDDSSGSFMVV